MSKVEKFFKDVPPNAVFVRSPYNYDMDAASIESGLLCEDPTLAQQSGAADCDINSLLERAGRGLPLPVADRLPQYGDFVMTANDYHTAYNQVIAAQEAFDSLPAKVRARFENDPAEMLDFVTKEENRDEAVALGLIPPAASPPAGDLSIPPAAKRAQHAGEAEGGVGKSSKERTSFLRRSKPDLEGDSGED